VLSDTCRRVLLSVARQEITSVLTGCPKEFPPRQPELEPPSGAFVSLHLIEGGSASLRGCIGVVKPNQALFDTVRECASGAAFRDPRFPPLTGSEIEAVAIEISVLSPLERITDVGLIRPGLHGILIEYGGRSGLLLPQVATERRWRRTTFLEQTCRKAGLPPATWTEKDAAIFIFVAEVFDETSLRMGS
jgi:AmmeMemoRadiSam system protein A